MEQTRGGVTSLRHFTILEFGVECGMSKNKFVGTTRRVASHVLVLDDDPYERLLEKGRRTPQKDRLPPQVFQWRALREDLFILREQSFLIFDVIQIFFVSSEAQPMVQCSFGATHQYNLNRNSITGDSGRKR
jgi:hypothetical protein